MKKIIALLMIVTFITVGAHAQKLIESEVPNVVKIKVATLYPDSKVEWMKNVDGNYQADLDENNTEICLTISIQGHLLNTKIKISVADLPTSVTDFVFKNKPGKQITSAFKETDVNGTLTNYKANVEKTCLIFDSKGVYLYSITKDREYMKYQN